MQLWLVFWMHDELGLSSEWYITVYASFGLVFVGAMGVAMVLYARGTVNASSSLHNTMLASVLCAPLAFFESTPLGRIVNRFMSDMQVESRE